MIFHTDGSWNPLKPHSLRLAPVSFSMAFSTEFIMRFYAFKHVRCNPDVAPRLNSDKLMLLPQSTYLPEGVPDFDPLLKLGDVPCWMWSNVRVGANMFFSRIWEFLGHFLGFTVVDFWWFIQLDFEWISGDILYTVYIYIYIHIHIHIDRYIHIYTIEHFSDRIDLRETWNPIFRGAKPMILCQTNLWLNPLDS